MAKKYRGRPADQLFLLPPSMGDWLPEGHLANFVVDTVDELDISPIESAIQSKDSRGTRPYDPRVMVALLVYAYATGVFSSRRIARGCMENVAFRVFSRDQQPFFTVIAEFRRSGPGQGPRRAPRRDQDPGQREQAQGDELRRHEAGRGAVVRRDRGVAGARGAAAARRGRGERLGRAEEEDERGKVGGEGRRAGA